MVWESIAMNKRRTSSSVSTYGGWRLVADTDPSCRGGVGVPAERLGVLDQLAQRQLVAPDRGGTQVTAVEEPLDRFFGDRTVRVALPPAVVDELAQDPFLDFEPVPAGMTGGDQAR
jgi:hypothetical protein